MFRTVIILTTVPTPGQLETDIALPSTEWRVWEATLVVLASTFGSFLLGGLSVFVIFPTQRCESPCKKQVFTG